MRTIEIDEDVYEYLKSKVTDFDQKPGDVLRLELLGPKSVTAKAEEIPHELSEALEQISSKFGTQAVDRFLDILAEVHRQKPEEFSKVLEIRGPKRCYFARSREEIDQSGTSTQPRQIPGSDYWVMTNSPTHRKLSMVRSVLSAMGYSKEATAAAQRTIRSAS